MAQRHKIKLYFCYCKCDQGNGDKAMIRVMLFPVSYQEIHDVSSRKGGCKQYADFTKDT